MLAATTMAVSFRASSRLGQETSFNSCLTSCKYLIKLKLESFFDIKIILDFSSYRYFSIYFVDLTGEIGDVIQF